MDLGYLSLLVASIIAFLMPYIAVRANIPVMVGEIALGIAVGFINVGFEWATGYEFLEFKTGSPVFFLSEIGFIFLLFLVGLEIDFNMIKDRGPQPIATSSAMFLMTLVLAYAAVWAIGLEAPLYIALVLATTSLGVVIPVVRELGINRTVFGQDIILAAVIADFATMILLPPIIGLETGASVWASLFMIPLILGVFGFLYLVGGQIMWRWPRTLSRFFREDDPHETGVRASFLIIMILVVLSQVVGTEAILGAFLAGAAISFMFRGSGALESKLFGFGYGFLIPLFFVRVGVQFSDYVSGEGGLAGLWLVPVFLVLAYAFKVAPAMLHSFEHGTKKSLAAGVLISGGLSLAIAAAEIGTTKGVIGQSTSAAIIFFAIVMAIASPIAFKRIYSLTVPKVVHEEEGVVVVAPSGEPQAEAPEEEEGTEDEDEDEDEAITVVPIEEPNDRRVRGR